MFRHMVVLVVAVAVALGLAQQMVRMTSAHAAPPVVAQAVPSLIPFSGGESGSDPVVQASPSPPYPQPSGWGAQLAKGADGHYWAQADVNGHPVHFLVDTGASFVALTRQDAVQLGLNPTALTYDAPVVTANGKTSAARVQLDYVSVSGVRVDHVPAMVIADGLSTSLLGMSYLERLSRFEATPTSLTLQP